METKTESAVSDEGTQARILAAATEMLADEGYAALSMRKLGARLGLSQAAIYRHYRDKAELVSTIAAACYEEMLGRVLGAAVPGSEDITAGNAEGDTEGDTESDAEGDAAGSLARAFRAYVAYALEKPRLYRSILLDDIGRAGRGLEVFEAGVTQRRRSFQALATCLEAGMDSGEFARADVELTAQALWAAMFGLTARLVVEGLDPLRDAERIEALVGAELGLILRGLSVTEPMRSGHGAGRR